VLGRGMEDLVLLEAGWRLARISQGLVGKD
jgi:hypothetical protein